MDATSNGDSSTNMLSASIFRVGHVLPSDSFITGTLLGCTQSDQIHPSGGARLTLMLRCSLENNFQLNDYTTAHPTSTETTCRVDIVLEAQAGQAGADIVKKDAETVGAMMKRILNVEASGLTVMKYEKGEKCMEAELSGLGDRQVRVDDGQTVRLLQPSSSVESKTPSWLHSPTPSLPDSSSIGGPSKAIDIPANLRPITSLPIPDVPPLQHPRNGTSRMNGQTIVKRMPSPEKMFEAKRRRRLEEERRRLSNGTEEGDVFSEPFPKHNGFVSRIASTSKKPIIGTVDTVQDTLDPQLEAVEEVLKREPDRSPVCQTNPGPTGATHTSPYTQPTDQDTVITVQVTPGRQSRTGPHAVSLPTSRTTSEIFPSKPERSSPIIKQSPAEPSRIPVPGRILSHSRHGSAQADPEAAAIQAANRRRREQLEIDRRVREAEAMDYERNIEDLQEPAGVHYRPIRLQENETWRSVMGIVIDYASLPRQTRQDYTTNIVIGDPSTHISGTDNEGMVITVFRPRPDLLPTVYPGQVILFRDILFKIWNEKIKGNAFSKDQGHGMNVWATMTKQGNVKTSTPNMIVSEEESARMKRLLTWWEELSKGNTNVGFIDEASVLENLSPKRKNCELGLVRPNEFCDPTFKVLQVRVNQNREPRYELYLTDGTVNPEPTHNWHNIDIGIPSSAVWTLAVFGNQTPEAVSAFVAGNFLMLRNVNVKRHRGNGPLELKWADRVTPDQKEAGWSPRKITVIPQNDHRATEINRKINALRRAGEGGVVLKSEVPAPLHADSPAATRPEVVPLATHISTTHTDLLRYPLSTLEDIKQNEIIPNKFRIRARVKSIYSRQSHQGRLPDYTTHFCLDCQKPFPSFHQCTHCRDPTSRIELRYRLIALLEMGEDDMLPIIIADEAAEKILPPLPPITTSESENDRKRKETRIKMANDQVTDVLLGAKMDGKRTRPLIDWTIETYITSNDKGTQNKKKETKVLVFRVFGMERSEMR